MVNERYDPINIFLGYGKRGEEESSEKKGA